MAYTESTSGANFSVAQSITASAASTNVFDVTGAGAGNAPAMIGAGGINTALGYDIGNGSGVEQPYVAFTIASVTTVTGTLTIAIQVAKDNGSYSPGTYYTLESTAALSGPTQLYAGAQIVLPVPPVPAGLIPPSATGPGLPRFYQLYYTVTGAISLVANANLVLDPSNVKQAVQYGKNFPDGL